jgi:hypothetical protein
VLAAGPNVVGVTKNAGAMDASGVSTADPKLGPLQDNGGPTLTMAPGVGSAALNVGTAVGEPAVDQRGAARGANPDLGAVEVVSPLTPVGVVADLFGPTPAASANEAYVKGLFRAVLQRDPDPAALAAWTSALNAGKVNKQVVAVSLFNSNENRGNEVKAFYRAFLDHDPDPAALSAWTTLLQTTADESVVLTGLVSSPEFAAKNDNSAFLNRLYYAVLGRNPDAASFAAYKSQLDAGKQTRAQVAATVLRSTEAVSRLVSEYYVSYLGRPADAASLAAGVQSIQAGKHFGQVAVALLFSQEFVDKAAASVPA